MAKNMIKCLTFDLDDTLWDIRPIMHNVDTKLYQWLDENAPLYTGRFGLDNFSRLRQHVIEHYPEIAHSVTDIRLKGLHIGLQQAGYPAEKVQSLAQQGFDIALNARQEVDYFPHVWAALDVLRGQGYQMGAITNGNADINRVGLSDYFDFQFNAHHAGVEKPDPVIFELMLKHTQLSANQIIHIGDNPIADVQGAQQLGMATIWVNVITQKWLYDFEADATISCISELPLAVKSIASRLNRDLK